MLTLYPPLDDQHHSEDDHMATATKTPTTPPVNTATPAKFTLGRFSFAVERGVAIPATVPKVSTANPLPFPEWFSAMAHNDHFFVPHSYWTAPKAEGGREADAAAIERAKPDGYARAKIRGSFNKWREEDANRAHLDITMANRKKGDPRSADGKEVFEDDGISVWLLDEKAKAPT